MDIEAIKYLYIKLMKAEVNEIFEKWDRDGRKTYTSTECADLIKNWEIERCRYALECVREIHTCHYKHIFMNELFKKIKDLKK